MDTIPQDTQGVKTYYLYIKTHNRTGLKYLGYTTAKDPHEYQGSGTYWKRHLKEHGADYTTEILLTTESLEEIRKQGEYYSELYQVFESKEWANIKPETGDGGWPDKTPETLAKMIETKLQKYGTLYFRTDESVKKMVETKRKNGTLKQTPETIAKIKETKRRNGTLNNNNNTPESIARGMETKRKNGTNGISPETRAKMVESRRNNGNYKRTPESIAKQLETKRKNGTLKRTPESIAKQLETKRKNGTLKWKPESIAKRTETRRRNQELKKQALLDGKENGEAGTEPASH